MPKRFSWTAWIGKLFISHNKSAGEFSIDGRLAEFFEKLFYEREPKNNRDATDMVTIECLRQCGTGRGYIFLNHAGFGKLIEKIANFLET
ncbi:MAG: hypothetical protein KGI33_02865 [Thaumarchaeota archaeon]|nr:hypothetical protein [Nitrososphaerota archaeon]